MKTIPLTRGLCAIVDDEDYEWLTMMGKWHVGSNRCFYAVRWESRARNNGKQKKIFMHRIILPSPTGVDHINGDGLDNRRSNLRVATAWENSLNRRKSSKATKSKYVGIGPHGRKWRADIVFHGKRKYLGLFKTDIEAAQAYNQMARILFGEFARLNNV